MIKKIILFIALLIAFNYIIMGLMVLVGGHFGWESECNPVYCTFTKWEKDVSTYCTRNGLPINCSEIENKFDDWINFSWRKNK